MVLSLPGLQFGQRSPAPSAPGPEKRLTVAELVRENEARIATLAEDYTRRYPVIREYGRDWMRDPELKKLNDDYMRSHDPVAFLTGLAGSRGFLRLVERYATQKPVRDFVVDAVNSAPPASVQASLDYVNGDARIKGLVEGVSRDMGVPPSVLAEVRP